MICAESIRLMLNGGTKEALNVILNSSLSTGGFNFLFIFLMIFTFFFFV